MDLGTDRTTFLAADVLLGRLRDRAAPPLPLAHAELRVHSQNGEDGVLVEVLRRIGIPAEPSFCEFGVETGQEGTCVFLADWLGWSGVFLEPNLEAHGRLAAKYAANPRVCTAPRLVTPENVDAVFAELAVPAALDVLSIDIDSVDYWVWRALTHARPRVVVIEYNGGKGAEAAMTVPPDHPGWDGTDYYGASIEAYRRLGQSKGYRLVHTDLCGVNAFFVREEDLHHFPEAGAPALRSSNFFLRAELHPPDPHDRPWVHDPPVA